MPRLNAIEVRLEVADVTRSAAFYADVLGAGLEMVWPDESPQFAILNRDGVRLQLSRRSNPSISITSPGCTLWIDVTGIASLHSTIKGKTNIEWGPEVYRYHRREFAFRDPDGHVVILSEATDDPPTCKEE